MARLLCVILLATAAGLSACGGERESSAAPGSAENPLVAQHTESRVNGRSNEAAAAKPDYEALVNAQSKQPQSRFTPCNLVTRAEARAILGERIRAPVEAPQGPTCIYRSRSGDSFTTLAVQSIDLAEVKRDIAQRRQVDVEGRPAYCGNYGQPMLYVQLSGGRVLSVAAPCDVARGFAVKALRQLAA
jgi:Protein of unknown function (DUF3558)